MPRNAILDSASTVTVVATLNIAADGSVTGVDIPNAGAHTRSFDTQVRRAAMQWRFPPGDPGRSYHVQFEFRQL